MPPHLPSSGEGLVCVTAKKTWVLGFPCSQDPIYLGLQGLEVDGPPPVGVLEFEKLFLHLRSRCGVSPWGPSHVPTRYPTGPHGRVWPIALWSIGVVLLEVLGVLRGCSYVVYQVGTSYRAHVRWGVLTPIRPP
jgi:hypothetical protein